jgi:catechol 2,3-dioxygenase-like lactoylglutathione lyase family enzyme
MSLSLDHVVIHVTDLDVAIADFSALGFNVQRGGAHAEGATHNALVGFADGSYLELIAFLKPHTTHRWAYAAERGLQGFVDFALLPSQMGAVIEAARGRGLDYRGPVAGGRLRPDGERLQWQIGTAPAPDLPFLCGDITARALRVPEGDVRVHANGVQGVSTITVAVTDADASLKRYRALLGAQADSCTEPVTLPGLGMRLASLPLGTATLLLVAPSPGAPAGGALRVRLDERGPGVIGLALRGPLGAAARALALDKTHGAAFEIVPG